MIDIDVLLNDYRQLHGKDPVDIADLLFDDDAECSCLPDLPDGRINGGRGIPCSSCLMKLRDDEIPFQEIR